MHMRAVMPARAVRTAPKLYPVRLVIELHWMRPSPADDTAIALFDAESLCVDGRAYRNTYAWFMKLKDGKLVEVTAFFDTCLFYDMDRR